VETELTSFQPFGDESVNYCQQVRSQSALNLEISRRCSTHLKTERPNQRDVGKTVDIDTWTDRDGTEDELEKRPQESRCNDSETTHAGRRRRKSQRTAQEVGERFRIELRAGKVGNHWVVQGVQLLS
jgi:hypothetical protein